MLRRLLLTTFALLGLALGVGSTAFAHNSLDSSTPADGETVDPAPSDVRLMFAKDVPLETLTVTLTDPTGARSELTGSRHGATAQEVLTPLPPLAAGAHSVRWRLVSSDGHAITGRVRFTVAATAPSSTAVADAGGSATTTTAAPPPIATDDDTGWSTPSWIRWLLRYTSYLAMMTVAGIAITEAYVWRRAASVRFRTLMSRALGVVMATAFLQWLVLAADISGQSPWSAFGELGAAADNPAGMALVIRIVLAFAAWLLIVHARPNSPEIYTDAVILLALGLLATWSFAGHSRSMRWPWLGVPIDVVHHGAAAAWVGGLAIVGATTIRSKPGDDTVEVVRRFSTLSAWSVGLIVATGIVQAIRLGGGPGDIIGSTHGRLLLVKLALLGGMLWLADRNRRLVQQRFHRGVVTQQDVALLRDTMRRELAFGLVIIGVTASLVVSPPASADADAAARPVTVGHPAG